MIYRPLELDPLTLICWFGFNLFREYDPAARSGFYFFGGGGGGGGDLQACFIFQGRDLAKRTASL